MAKTTAKKDALFPDGAVVGGYRVVHLLGRGGMAEVYAVEALADDAAKSIHAGCRYALKAFRPNAETSQDFSLKRFVAEGRLLARLHHPRVVRVYDFGSVTGESDVPYFVMDLVLDATGKPCTLKDELKAEVARAESTADDALDEATEADGMRAATRYESRVAGWYEDLREGLAYIHGKNIVHRDVKLENVLIGSDGRAVLSDFGVAKVAETDLRKSLELSMVTRFHGEKPCIGTFAYMAPELRNGTEASPASDFWALGVLLYHLLTQDWYQPGCPLNGVLDCLDPYWRTILAGLLNPDASQRVCLPWQTPLQRENARLADANEKLQQEKAALAERGTKTRRLLGGVGLLAGVFAGLAGAVAYWHVRADAARVRSLDAARAENVRLLRCATRGYTNVCQIVDSWFASAEPLTAERLFARIRECRDDVDAVDDGRDFDAYETPLFLGALDYLIARRDLKGVQRFLDDYALEVGGGVDDAEVLSTASNRMEQAWGVDVWSKNGETSENKIDPQLFQ